MPTARELLDQADALMRRNRLGTAEAPRPANAEDGIPTLLDVVNVAAQNDAPAPATARDVAEDGTRPAQPADLEDVPVLTDAVEEIEAASVLDEPDTADASMWSDTFTAVHSIIGGEAAAAKAGSAAAAEPPAPAKPPLHLVTPGDAEPVAEPPADEAPPREPVDISEPLLETVEAPHADDTVEAPQPAQPPAAEQTVPFAATGEAVGTDAVEPSRPGAPPAPPAADDARWAALAEEIRMQVLQRIDIFTDTGLREQLAVRLQPIVDRASADLVATINQHVGILLRAYVSEAIEREIDRWRNQTH